MIRYVQNQDILKVQTEALVTSVTTAGSMSQGLALQIASAYPDVEREYKEALKQGNLAIGKVWALMPQGAPYIVILFPTSPEESRKSKLEYIKQGMENLKDVVEGHGWKTLAMPKLGTGVGGLEWEKVQKVIVDTLLSDGLDDVDVYIYE